jgi:tetratricopeptide (TPR) repeat protein
MTAYLEATLDPGEKTVAENHLANCTECRRTLAELMRLLNHEGRPVTPEEEAELKAISSGWIGRPEPIVPAARRRGPFLASLGVAAAIVAALVVWITGPRPAQAPQSAEAIVQSILNKTRPFEPRLAGQPYIQYERTRSAAETAGVDYDLIGREMDRFHPDSYSLGRFYLFQRDFERAIPFLEEAASQPGASAAVHNDLGAAYIAAGGGPASLERAEAELQRALTAETGYAPAVFNLGLFYERSGNIGRARMEWLRYIQLDTQSGWAEEIRLKLEVTR